MDLIEIVKDDRCLSLVTIPPFVRELFIGMRVKLPCLAWFSSTWRAVKPHSFALWTLSMNVLVIFLDLLDTIVVPYPNISRDLLNRSLLRILPDYVPVRGTVPPKGSGTEFPRTFDPCVFFHAVLGGAVVASNANNMDAFPSNFDEDWLGYLFLQMHERLDVRGTWRTPFYLSWNVVDYRQAVDLLQVLLGLRRWLLILIIVNCQQVSYEPRWLLLDLFNFIHFLSWGPGALAVYNNRTTRAPKGHYLPLTI